MKVEVITKRLRERLSHLEQSVTVQWEIITPDLAKEYLESNTHNRKVRRALVARYAKDIKAFRWTASHQGVAFSEDGTLLDGQHRLLGIVESGVPTILLVLRGLPIESQLNMDSHAMRGAHDSIALLGDTTVTKDHVAIVRSINDCGKKKGVGAPIKTALTNTEIKEMLDEFRECIDWSISAFGKKKRGITSAPILAAAALAYRHVADIARLHEFVGVFTGRDLPSGMQDKSALTLREFVLTQSFHGGGMFRLEIFLKTQRAIYGFIKKEPLSKIYAGEIYYPYDEQKFIR